MGRDESLARTILDSVGQRLDIQDGDLYAVRGEFVHHSSADAMRASSNNGEFLVPLPRALVAGEHPTILGPGVENKVGLENKAAGQDALQHTSEKHGLFAREG